VWPIAGRASASAAPTTRRKKGRSIWSPTASAACDCARRTRAERSTRTVSNGGRRPARSRRDQRHRHTTASSFADKSSSPQRQPRATSSRYECRATAAARGTMMIDVNSDRGPASTEGCGSTPRATSWATGRRRMDHSFTAGGQDIGTTATGRRQCRVGVLDSKTLSIARAQHYSSG